MKNIEEQPFVFILACAKLGLCMQTCSCVHNLNSCLCSLVLAYVYLFFNLCVSRILSLYAYKILCTQDLSCLLVALSGNPNLNILAPFSPVFHLFAILKSPLTIFELKCMSHVIFYPIMHPISFSHHSFLLIMNLISLSFAGLSSIFR